MEKLIIYGVIVIIAMLVGFICYKYAEKKGLNKEAWFSKGAVLTSLALLVVLFFVKKYEKNKK